MPGSRANDTAWLPDAPSTVLEDADLGPNGPPDRRMADAVRTLALDAIETAGSGHAALPLGMADAATALWTRHLRFDAADPRWADRDRFVLSAGHGASLLYALLHLTGHVGMGAGELDRFRRLDSPASGNPEYGAHPAIEATTGPLGQGLSNAVGLALAERMLASRFGRSLVDHRTWVIASDGDLMQGVAQEAADLAGHLRLEKLTVLWDDNGTLPEADPALARSADPLKLFAAQGWATKRIDGNDPAQLGNALSLALRSRKPTLLACRTAPPGHVTPVSTETTQQWANAGSRGAAARRAWLKRLTRHPMRAEFERVSAGKLPDGWHERLAALRAEIAEERTPRSGRDTGLRVLSALTAALPELIGGSADIGSSTRTLPPGIAPVAAGHYAGRHIHFGVREHAMAAALNGVALHGGFLPYGGCFCTFSDGMRPALRLAAMMRLRVVHVLTHDGIGVGEDGPTHQPVEQLASFRALPNMHVFRPADALETAECWEIAIRRSAGPSLILLSRQPLAPLRQDASENRSLRGGYVLQEANGPRQATLIATGSEVAIALDARSQLAEAGIAVAVVSLPCWELFAQQDEGYRNNVLGSAPKIGIEAACGFGWERWIGESGIFIGMTGFGASAPYADLYRHFGITPEAITAAVRCRVQPN